MHSILIGSGKTIYSLTIFLLTVFASRYFSINDYGLFREFYLYFIIGISVSGIPAVNAVYFFTKRNFKNLLVLFFMSLLTSLIVLLIIFLFAKKYFIFMVILSVPGSIFYLLFDALLISEKHYKKAFIITLIESFSYIIVVPLIVFLKWNFTNYINLFTIIALFKIVVYPILIFTSCSNRTEYSFREMFVYTFPVYINNLVGIVSGKIDKYIVSYLFGPITFAFYSSGAFEIPLIGRFITGVFHSKATSIRNGIENKSYNKIKNDLSKLLFIIFPIVGLIAILFAINARFVIGFLYSNIYQDAYLFFTVYLFIMPFRLIPIGFLLNLAGKTKELMYLGIGDAILTLITSIILIHLWGPVGGAFAFVSITLIQIIFIVVLIRKFFPWKVYFFQNALILIFLNIAIMMNNIFNFNPINNLLLLVFAFIELLIFRWSKKWK